MPKDAQLAFLESIDARLQLLNERMEKNMGEFREMMSDGFETHGNRLSSLENTRSQQRGVMIAGGAFVTTLSGISAWIVDHLWGH